MRTETIRPAVITAAAVFFFGLAFAIYTQHAWEDYLITFTCSQNLATGHGLVYTPGERLHTFTSPLGVLLPAGFCWLTGNRSDELVLWLFRLTSLAALAAGMVLLFQTLRRLLQQRLAIWVTLALVGLDAKLVDFSINGMETGLLFFFLALAIHGLVVPGPRQMLRTGIGWAGLMWTRPDSFVYIGALGFSALLFLSERTTGQSRRSLWKTFLLAGLVCTVLYLPWFVWAWHYYGSPVPHTIVAKAANRPPVSIAAQSVYLFLFPWTLLTDTTSAHWVFAPAEAFFGGWPALILIPDLVLALAAVFAWLFPGVRPHTRLFSLVFFLGNFYLTSVIASPHFAWYLPPVAVFGYLTLGLLFDQMLCLAARSPQPGEARRRLRLPAGAPGALACLLVTGQLFITLCVAREMRLQQQIIETGQRREIGLWLRAHARTPHDTVMLEPLGYIGYYSGLKMYDYPGLASKKMIEVRKQLGPYREDEAFLKLKPDWMVLRPNEIVFSNFVIRRPLDENYEQVQKFDVSQKIRDLRWVPGRPYLEFDQTFLIFHRKPDARFEFHQ